MTAGQWEQFEAPAAKAMEQYWAHLKGRTDEPDEIDFALANAVLNVVGPLIAEDTRDRLVAAASQAVEREPAPDVEAACKATAEYIVAEIERCTEALVAESDDSGTYLVAAVMKKAADIARVAGGLT